MNRASAALAAMLLTLGCTPTTTITPLTNTSFRAKTKDCDIQILTEPPKTRKYTEIAILNTVTDSANFSGLDLNAMLPSIKETACGLGADAVIIKNVIPGQGQVSSAKAYTVAIKYLD